MSAKKASARERAEAERLEQARRARQRERMLRIGISAAVLLVVVVVGIVLLRPDGQDRPEGTGAIPDGAVDDGTGVAVGEASAPVTVDYWLDFQCPACGEFEAENGAVLEEIVADGTARVIYHPTAFRGEESHRASNAFGCAIDAGRPVEYLTELFAHQPDEGSGGYAEDQLIAHGEAAGIADAQFKSCVSEGTYSDWGATVLDAMRDQDIESTPTVMIDGEPLEDPTALSAEEFRSVVDDAVTSS